MWPQLIQYTVSGFLGAAGFSTVGEKIQDNLDLASVLTEEEQENAGLKDKKFDLLRKLNWPSKIVGKAAYSIAIGAGISIFAASTAENIELVNGIVENALPAFIGGFVSSTWRRKRRKKELAIKRKIMDNPETVEDYLTPREKKLVDQAVEELDKRLKFQGNLNLYALSLAQTGTRYDSIALAFSVLGNSTKAYAPEVNRWFSDLMYSAGSIHDIATNLTRFYGDETASGYLAAGNPEKSELNLYVMEGSDLVKRKLQWEKIELVKVESDQSTYVKAGLPELVSEEKIDYDDGFIPLLRKELCLTNAAIMFFKGSDFSSVEDQIKAASSSYLDNFMEYHTEEPLPNTN